MKRKIFVGALVLFALLIAWRLRGRDATPAPAVGSAGRSKVSGAPRVPGARVAGQPGGSDREPDGGLRLEGQVLGPDGAPIGGAEVSFGWASRTTTTEADGSFAFDKLVARSYFVSAVSGVLIGGPVFYRLTEHSDPVVVRLGEAASGVVVVVDEAKRPIAGATVTIRVGTPVPKTFATGADGRVHVAPLAPGVFAAEATAVGYAPAAGSLLLGSPGATGELTIELRRGVAVSGRVIDEGGAPIAGARVDALAAWQSRLEAAATTSDADGRFTIASLSRGIYTLRANDDEHAPARSLPVGVVATPVAGVTIVMTAAGVISGRVFDLAHAPVPFAVVTAFADDAPPWLIEARTVTADAQGTFKLSGLARHALQLAADTGSARSKPIRADLGARSPLEVELVLDAVETIAGRVVDGAGAPVPEVQVTAMADPYAFGFTETPVDMPKVNSPGMATTRGDGSFVIGGLVAGTYRVSATQRADFFSSMGDPSRGTPARAGDRDLRITLLATGTLIGKVVLAGSGAAPNQATVMLSPRLPVTTTNGVFQIQDLVPGTYQVFIQGPEFADLFKMGVEIKAGATTDLGTLEARRGRILVGTVVDGAGSPVPGAKVRLGVVVEHPGFAPPPSEGFGNLVPRREAEAGPDGTFTMAGVPEFRSTPPTQVMAYDPAHGSSPLIELPVGKADPPPMKLTLGAPGPRP